MAVTYYAILTAVGAAKLANAAALGTTLQITQMAVGDGAGNVPVPDANRTTLVNEVRRAPLNQLKIDPANASQVIAEQVIPETVGGWWIREIGLLDNTGALIAIANCAPSYKPQLAEGSGRTQTVRMVLIVNNTGAVELKIDPSVVLATREYVDTSIVTAINRQDAKASVRVATTASIALNGLPTVDGVVLAAGDRVLVKNQATGSQNGIYVAAVGAWARSQDADENAEVTPSLTVSVETGTTQADTVWQLITDAPIVIGTTALVFQDITNGLARLASPAFTGNPTAPTPAQFDADTSIATTEFVQRALGNIQGVVTISTSQTLALADAGKLINIDTTTGNVTLTLPANAPAGTVYRFMKASSQANTATIVTSAQFIGQGTYNAGTAVNSIVLRQFDGLEVTSFGPASNWAANGGISGSAFLSANGYQKLPSGLIIQWGTSGLVNSGSSLTITLPIAFPNAHVQAVVTANGGVNIATPICSAVTTPNTTTLVVYHYSGGGGSANYRWVAIGY